MVGAMEVMVGVVMMVVMVEMITFVKVCSPIELQ